MAKRAPKHGISSAEVIVPFIVIIVLALLAFLYVDGNALFNAQAPATTTAPSQTPPQTQPQPVSATLSLDDPTELPTSVAEGDIMPFSFTIQNGNTPMTNVQYKVSVVWSTGESDVIDENVLSLAAGQSTSIQESLKFEVAKETARITVQFEQGGPQLAFTLPRGAVQ